VLLARHAGGTGGAEITGHRDVTRSTRRTVGFLRHNFLPPSETFIYSSLRSLTRYDAQVFAVRRLQADKFPCDQVTALRSLPLGRLEALLYGATTWSPRYFSWARGIHLLHAHMGYTGVYGLLAAARYGLPLITSFYGHDVTIGRSRDRFHPDHWHYWLLRRHLFAAGQRFIVLSEHMGAALAAQGCPPEKLRIVRLGTDLERFRCAARPARRGATVLMVGREVAKKGFADGLRACAEARRRGADLRVVLLGTGGPLKPQLERLASELALPVEWPAPTTPVQRAMQQADILLVPSRTADSGDQEGTPTVICEGSAAGLPIVSTRHAGIPEQVEHGVTGLLAAERDVSALAGHLVALAGDPERRRALGQAGRDKMQAEYSLEAHRRSLEAVYDEVS
jgi:glycosyltransferase involved in cell wall biosynthesis